MKELRVEQCQSNQGSDQKADYSIAELQQHSEGSIITKNPGQLHVTHFHAVAAGVSWQTLVERRGAAAYLAIIPSVVSERLMLSLTSNPLGICTYQTVRVQVDLRSVGPFLVQSRQARSTRVRIPLREPVVPQIVSLKSATTSAR